MKTAVFAYSRQGCRTARTVQTCLEGETVLYTIPRLAEPGFSEIQKPSRMFYGARFEEADALIFVGSCGIAVREIAPFVADKKTDPAVIVIDELGKFVISLLSGHIGGANALALRLAGTLGAMPVITTATDINRKFSVDAWAARHGFCISSMAAAKAVSAEILEKDVWISSDFPVSSPLPAGLKAGGSGDLGIYLTWKTEEPYGKTLRLIPKVLHLGVGCRKGTPASAIHAAVDQVLTACQIDRRSIRDVSSIDLKKEEAGLLEFARDEKLPIVFYTAQQLSELTGEFTPSAFVSSITGVDNVCERSAMMKADRLIVKKTVSSGVTVAVAAENLEVDFG